MTEVVACKVGDSEKRNDYQSMLHKEGNDEIQHRDSIKPEQSVYKYTRDSKHGNDVSSRISVVADSYGNRN